VTSLGLVQLTRKKLGTGLIEAFSTTCPHCSGRGIMLHADPVDSAPSIGRKPESGGRRGRRSKKGKAEEQPVAKVPAHSHGDHPMFKAMAAANGGSEDDETEGTDHAHGEDADETAVEQAAETDARIQQQVAREVVEDDLDDADFEDEDSDDDDDEDDDTEEVDLDDDDEDLDDDDELEDADDDEDDDDDDGDDSDDDDDDSAEHEHQVVAATAGAPRRRRAAARPAGPPAHED